MKLTLDQILLRIGIVLAYFLISIIFIFGISRIWNYLDSSDNTIHSRHDYAQIKKYYRPQLTFDFDVSCEKQPDTIILSEITNDYFNALYSYKRSLLESKNLGIQDYFTLNLFKKIEQNILANKKTKTSISSTTLNHHLHIDYFSNDAHLVMFEDSQVMELSKVYQDQVPIVKQYNQSDYSVIMKFDDGKWQIHNYELLNTKPKEVEILPLSNKIYSVIDSQIYLNNEPFDIIGINYYPQKTPWTKFWSHYDKKVIKSDLELLKKSGFNTVRIFIPFYETKNYDDAHKIKSSFEHFLNEANRLQIKVIPTLFDFFYSYNTTQWTLSSDFIRDVVTPVADHPAILAWDIKNEPDLDFDTYQQEQVVDWLEFCIYQVRTIDSTHMITIGWSNLERAKLLSPLVDIVSAHYYKKPNEFTSEYQALKSSIVSKPIVIEEYGTHSYNSTYFPGSKTIQDQADYYQKMQEEFQINGVKNTLPWTLYDFVYVPNEVVGKLPWRKQMQKNFGFITKNGEIKPSYQYVAPNYSILKKKQLKNDPFNYFYVLAIVLIFFLLSIGFYSYWHRRAIKKTKKEFIEYKSKKHENRTHHSIPPK